MIPEKKYGKLYPTHDWSNSLSGMSESDRDGYRYIYKEPEGGIWVIFLPCRSHGRDEFPSPAAVMLESVVCVDDAARSVARH